MGKETPIDSLLDVLEWIERIQRQTDNLTAEQFAADTDVQDATAYRLLSIGEASRDFDEDLKARNSHIPWRQILGLWNILAHE